MKPAERGADRESQHAVATNTIGFSLAGEVPCRVCFARHSVSVHDGVIRD
jgi:hypothetical protein